MNVIQAEYGSRVKVIAVLRDSTDYVKWVNRWMATSFMEVGIRPLAIYSTEVQELDKEPNGFGNTMIHVVNWDGQYGRIEHA